MANVFRVSIFTVRPDPKSAISLGGQMGQSHRVIHWLGHFLPLRWAELLY